MAEIADFFEVLACVAIYLHFCRFGFNSDNVQRVALLLEPGV